MPMTFYQYPSCSTCRKGRAWLDAHSIAYTSVHIVDAPPTREQIEQFWRDSGLDLKRFFNTSGGSYRALNLKDTYAELSDEARLDLLAADGKLIKRPILSDGQGGILVGFKPQMYDDASFLKS
jgi:arsenate reductase